MCQSDCCCRYDEPGGLEGDIIEQLEGLERHHDLAPARTSDTGPRRLRNILDRLHATTGQRVVVLVDEYDKLILDVIDKPEMATENRDYLRGFYGIISTCCCSTSAGSGSTGSRRIPRPSCSG